VKVHETHVLNEAECRSAVIVKLLFAISRMGRTQDGKFHSFSFFHQIACPFIIIRFSFPIQLRVYVTFHHSE